LFCNTILNQGTPEQANYWTNKGMMDFSGMVGCFSMTEIGHGSNVAGLETTATFIKETDEFIIHSPTLTSTKFWIGGAAESATHTYNSSYHDLGLNLIARFLRI
jgi:acyl-CoA oxidase